jgi:2-polyprenyl-6-methoxyphenol hydroxylase-like FAD-dependent oxidoreductase
MAGRLDCLRRRFTGFDGIVEEYLAALESDEQIHCGPVDWIALEKDSSRVVLIGDAAHASSPMMVQGGCMAMEDAWVLAESWGEAQPRPGPREIVGKAATARELGAQA